jgi:hypothetical protein
MGSSRFVRKVAIGLPGQRHRHRPDGGSRSRLRPRRKGRHPLDGSMPKWLHQAHDMGA